MSNFDDLFQGFEIMLGCWLAAIILSYFGGYILDHLFSAFDFAGMFDVPPQWDAIGTTYTFLNIWYAFCSGIGLLGTYLFIRALTRKQGYDSYVLQ